MNRALKWVLIGGVGIVLVAVAAVYFVLTGYDYNSLKPRISSAVEGATGRKLAIGGDIDLSVGLTPSLVISDVSFANAEWGSRPELAKVKRFEVQVALMPLLDKKIEVKRFILVEPDILVETNKEGKLNVVMDAPAAEPKEKPAEKQPSEKGEGAMELPSLSLNEFVIENAKFTYKDSVSNQTHHAVIKKLTAASESMDSPVKIALEAMYNDARIQVDGELGALNAATNPAKDWPLDLKIQALGIDTSIKGKIKDLMTPSGLDLSLAFQIAGFEQLEPLVKPIIGMDLPPVAPVKFSAKIADTGKMAFQVSDLELTFGEKALNGQVKGAIQDVVKQEGMNLNVSLAVSDFKPLEPFIKPYLKEGLPPVAPVGFSADIKGDMKTVLAVENMDFSFGDKAVKGGAKGKIADIFKQEGIELKVSAQVSDFKPLEPFIKPYLKEGPPPVAPVSFSADIKGDMKTALAVDNMIFSFGDKAVKGGAKGRIADALKQEGIDLNVAVQVADFKPLEPFLKPYLKKGAPPVAPVDFSARVRGDAKSALAVDNLNLSFGEKDIRGQVKGSVRNATAPQGIKLDVSLDISDFQKLAEFLETELPPVAPVSFKAGISDTGEMAFKVQDMLLTFAGNDISGNAGVDLSSKTPVVKANFASRKMDINSVLDAMKKEEKGDGSQGQAGKPGGETADKKRPDKVFPDDPLPLDLLKTVDANLWYNADDLYLPSLALHKFKLVVALENGNLKVTLPGAELGGGKVNANIDLKQQADNSAVLNAFIATGQVDAGAMLKEMNITDVMSGLVNVDVKLQTAGGSVARLMGNLNGYSKAIMENGAINNRYVGLIGAKMDTAVAQILMPSAKKKDYTAINCFVSRFDFKNGLADTTVLAIDSEYMGVVGEGRIDLGKETLDMAVAPKPKDKVAEVGLSLGSLAKNFRIGGTLAKPAVKMDAAQTVDTVGKAILGIKQKGNLLGALSAMEEDTTLYEDLCSEAKKAASSGQKLKLEAKQASDKKAASTTEGSKTGTAETGDSTQDKTKKEIEQVGNALKGLFGK